MMPLHRFLYRLSVCVGVSLTCACGGAQQNGQTIVFWAMGREGENVKQLMPAFEREHPGVHVEVQTLPFKAAHQKLLTSFAGRTTPDLCQLGNTWVAEFSTLNALEPLQAYVDASSEVEQPDYFPGIWDTNVIDGHLYGVPWYVDTRLLFYRKDLLAKAGFDHPPRDWQEWTRQMTAIKRMVGPDRYAALLPLNEFEQLESFGLQQAQPMLREQGRYGNFESPGFKRALAFYAQFFRNDWAPKVTNAEVSNPWNEFGRGYFVFYLSGPWNIKEFKTRLPAELQHNWATAPLPGPDGPGLALAGGSSLVIFRASRHKPAAWALIEYLSRPDVQRKFYALVGDMPPRRSSWQHSALASDSYAQAFYNQLERVKSVPKVPEWERIASHLALVGERLAHGQLDVDQVARQLDRQADHILAKRRWVLDRKQPTKAATP